MIEKLGARNLKDILITYVPGMTFSQDHNEINVSMRGIYGSSQQKILIMQDGHRLNSRAYSSANPDYAISLDKIKQIEILRGPASSLYGNVALTAVINIITKKGKDINGGKISTAIGNYGQKRLNFTYGNQFSSDNDLVMWGSYFESDGQKIDILKENDYSDKPQVGTAIIDGIKDRPSYDLGLKYNFGDFSIFANTKYSHYIEPFSGGGETGEAYDYNKIRLLRGEGPGLGSGSSHLGATFQKNLGNDFHLMINGYNDYNQIGGTIVTDPSTQSFGYINWNEYDLGFTSQLNKNYKTEGWGEGTALIGLQVDYMRLFDSSFPAGTAGEFTKFNDTKVKPLLESGDEVIFSGFGQLKHKIFDNLIFNLGMRYDEKKRKEGENVRALSPRLAVIYLPSDMFELKASYSQSFVDAPYWYRYNSLASYSGSRDLKPEVLKSIQLSPTVKFFEGRLNNTLNLFYNDLNDFIYRDPNAKLNDPKYRNAGVLQSVGLEEEVAWIQDFYSVRGNLTYQRVLNAKDYPVTGNDVNNVPSLTGNVIFDINPLYWIYNNLSFNLTARYVGSQKSPIANLNKNGQPFNVPNNIIEQVLFFNTGIRFTEPWLNKFTFDARIYNLLDTQYKQGGSTQFPYPQAGRWFLADVSYKF